MCASCFEDECPERGEHGTKPTPSCQSEQHIPQRPAAQWCSLVGERKWAVARQLVRARAKLQSRAVLWVAEQQKEGFGRGSTIFQPGKARFKQNLFSFFLAKLVFPSSSSFGSHLIKGNLLSLILLPPEFCYVYSHVFLRGKIFLCLHENHRSSSLNSLYPP